MYVEVVREGEGRKKVNGCSREQINHPSSSVGEAERYSDGQRERKRETKRAGSRNAPVYSKADRESLNESWCVMGKENPFPRCTSLRHPCVEEPPTKNGQGAATREHHGQESSHSLRRRIIIKAIVCALMEDPPIDRATDNSSHEKRRTAWHRGLPNRQESPSYSRPSTRFG